MGDAGEAQEYCDPWERAWWACEDFAGYAVDEAVSAARRRKVRRWIAIVFTGVGYAGALGWLLLAPQWAGFRGWVKLAWWLGCVALGGLFVRWLVRRGLRLAFELLVLRG